jgi:ribosomal protein L13
MAIEEILAALDAQARADIDRANREACDKADKIIEGRFPERIIEKAVQRMITRNKLGTQVMTKLRIYKGAEHPHVSQNPEVLDVASMNPKNKRRA